MRSGFQLRTHRGAAILRGPRDLDDALNRGARGYAAEIERAGGRHDAMDGNDLGEPVYTDLHLAQQLVDCWQDVLGVGDVGWTCGN